MFLVCDLPTTRIYFDRINPTCTTAQTNLLKLRSFLNHIKLGGFDKRLVDMIPYTRKKSSFDFKN